MFVEREQIRREGEAAILLNDLAEVWIVSSIAGGSRPGQGQTSGRVPDSPPSRLPCPEGQARTASNPERASVTSRTPAWCT